MSRPDARQAPSLARIVLGVALVAALVRFAHLISFYGSPFYLLPPLDGEVYLLTAKQPIEGVYFQSPGYVHFLKAVLAVWNGMLGFRVVQCLLGTGTAALTTIIAARVVRNRWWALVACPAASIRRCAHR